MTDAVVDTSVWIDFLRGTHTSEEQMLGAMLKDDVPVYLTATIVQEILQGVVSDEQFLNIQSRLMAFPVLMFEQLEAAIGAAELYRNARKSGLTVRKSVDCLIAWHAIRADLPILHRDRDFDALARVSDLSIIQM